MNFLPLFLILGLMVPVFATENLEQEVEVGAPQDCVVLGKSQDQDHDEVKPSFQHMVMDCLSPQVEIKSPEPKKKITEAPTP